MKEFLIQSNQFVECDIKGYFHQEYKGFQKPGNPDFLNVLKNTFNEIEEKKLEKAKDSVLDILISDIPEVMSKENLDKCLLVCVPRAKSSYLESQLKFKDAVKTAALIVYNTSDGTK